MCAVIVLGDESGYTVGEAPFAQTAHHLLNTEGGSPCAANAARPDRADA